MSLRCSGTTPRRSPRRHVCRSVPLDATWQAGTHVHDTATFAATLHVRPGLPTSRRLACSGLGLPFVPCVADRRRRRVAPCRFARCVFLIHKGPPGRTSQGLLKYRFLFEFILCLLRSGCDVVVNCCAVCLSLLRGVDDSLFFFFNALSFLRQRVSTCLLDGRRIPVWKW